MEMPTACSAFVGDLGTKLGMASTGHTLPKDSGEGLRPIFRPHEGGIFGHQASRQFVVTVLTLIGKPLVQTGHEAATRAPLRLRQTLCSVAQFLGMRNFLAIRCRQQMQKDRIKANDSIGHRLYGLGARVDEQAEIPARRPLDDATTFDTALGKVLGVEAHAAYAWKPYPSSLWRLQRIGERNTGELVALAFQPGLLHQFREAALPCDTGRVQHALQGMTGDAQLFAMIRQQIVEGVLGVEDAVFGILLDLANGPVPDARQLEQPGVERLFLRASETKLELTLQHVNGASGFRCTV